jgi:tRNA modification GTPase
VNLEETIVALSTPRGRGGIGVVRLSGDAALPIALHLVARKCAPLSSDDASSLCLEPRRATVVNLTNGADGSLIDEAVVTYFKGPNSYTGEDLVEISCHGSPVVVERVIQLAMENGARVAEPGEFTLRAFLQGRMDLVQAEAVHDLIEARTFYQAQIAIQQAHGALSRQLVPLKEGLVDLISLLEAGIDFAEDDVPVLDAADIHLRLDPVLRALLPIVESYTLGRIIREGLSLAIVGQPNVGKSSLFNRLLASDRAIVTDIPGTTRDVISESAQIRGIPVRLVDTAGIRESRNMVEREGVARSYAALADSDLVLLVLDASQPWDPSLESLFHAVIPLKHVIVFNKCDLEIILRIPDSGQESASTVRVSAKTGEGISQLQDLIFEMATGHAATDAAAQSIVTNLRHQQLLLECQRKLRSARAGVESGEPHEVILLDLYGALRAMDTVTGATTAEDILGNIFSKFCVGK